MPKKQTSAATDVGLAVQLQGDAIATGQETLAVTTTNLTVTAKMTGSPKVKATGEVTALAVSEAETGGTTSASAFTTAYSSDADKVKIRTTEYSFQADGAAYSYSGTTIKASESGKGGDPKVSIKTTSKTLDEAAFDIDGNLGVTDFAVTAEGPSTFADVEAYAFAEEEALSQSTILATAAVDIF
jgi:hypothetical protein